MWNIGIIDDKESERADIQVAILENVKNKKEIRFKEYAIQKREKEDLFSEILRDISEEEIQTLIVDYRLDTSHIVIKGWEIVDYIHESVPEFPVIVMTNAPDESRESPFIDADKVYPKIIFLDTQNPATAIMVRNIELNIQRYEQRRKELEGRLEMALKDYNEGEMDEEALGAILALEDKLGKYKETNQTMLDHTLDLEELKDVLKEIREIEAKLGE